MKRVLIIALTMLLAVMSVSCSAGGSSVEKTIDIKSVDEVKVEDYAENLDGLIDYFKHIGYILCPENGTSNATETKLNAEIINAKAGKRFQFTYEGSTVTMELYEFYTGENATPSDALAQVKKDGKFDVLGIDEFEAYISDNDKYMLIYTDNNKDEANVQRKNDVIKLFKSYK